KTDRGREVVSVARPNSKVRIFRIRSNKDNLSRSGFCLTAVVVSLVEIAAGNAEIAGVSVDWTSRPEVAGSTSEVRHAEQIPAQSKVQREIRAQLPIVSEEPIEFVLMIFADLTSGSVGLAGVMVRRLIVEELRVRGLPRFESLRRRRNGSRKESQH